jgi:hypothetical protein
MNGLQVKMVAHDGHLEFEELLQNTINNIETNNGVVESVQYRATAGSTKQGGAYVHYAMVLWTMERRRG